MASFLLIPKVVKGPLTFAESFVPRFGSERSSFKKRG